jgi:hypothetical protein
MISKRSNTASAKGRDALCVPVQKVCEMDDDLMKAATHAAAMLGAVYQWADRVKENGGPACLSGIATCTAMLKSLEGNRAMAEKLVMEPLRAAIEKASQ